MISGSAVGDGETVVRVRRPAHGMADWITTETTDIKIELRAGGSGMNQPNQLLDALSEVIDPDLGVNIVDLGFVTKVAVSGARTAELEMTLTSPACPLTKIIEDQIRTAIVDGGLVADFHVTWVWSPPWRPARVTESGREQLRAIGFSL